jgi:hypothetical protein
MASRSTRAFASPDPRADEANTAVSLIPFTNKKQNQKT